MNDLQKYLLAVGAPVVLLLAVVYFFLRPAWQGEQKLEDDAYWKNAIASAPVTRDTVHTHDTIPAKVFSGVTQGVRLVHDTITVQDFSSLSDCRSEYQILADKYNSETFPFEAQIPFDKDSRLHVTADPKTQKISWEILIGAMVNDGLVVTLTKSVLDRPQEPFPLSLDFYGGYQQGLAGGISVNYQNVGLGRIVSTGLPPITFASYRKTF